MDIFGLLRYLLEFEDLWFGLIFLECEKIVQFADSFAILKRVLAKWWPFRLCIEIYLTMELSTSFRQTKEKVNANFEATPIKRDFWKSYRALKM